MAYTDLKDSTIKPMNIFKTWYFQRFVILKLSLTKTIELIALYKTNMLDKTIDTNLKEEWFWIAKNTEPEDVSKPSVL